MKNNLKNIEFLLIAFVLLLLVASCKRDQTTWDGELTTTIDNNFADGEFNSIRNMVDTEGRADTSIYGKTAETTGIFCPAAVVTVTHPTTNTAALTVDFGSGCNCLDGRLRSGKLHATFSGKWKDSGSTVTVTPESYTVAGYAFSFTAVITVNPRNSSNQMNWTTVVTNAVLTHPTSGTITWDATRTTTWVEGEGSFSPSTYAYEMTGTANGIARNNLAFTATVDQPLRIELDCQYIVSGVWSITPQGREKRSIDYGTTGCDNQATLTVGNFTTQISLP